MKEYSMLLKDSGGVYTISEDKLHLVEYSGHYEDFNYGFFNVNNITLPNVFNVIADEFNILICERVKVASPTIEGVEDVEVDNSSDRYGLQFQNGSFVLPNGALLDESCDITKLPLDKTEYITPIKSLELPIVKIKQDGKYNFYSATLNKAEWDNIDRIEVIE